MMKFSLVTTCFNEIKSFPCWKSDVLAQTRQPDEIIIVDSLSSDGTMDELIKWSDGDARVRVVFEKCSVARGRNIAIRQATHDYVVSTDMGVRIDARWFEEIVKPFEADSSIEIVAGSYAVDVGSIKSVAARAEYYIEGDGCPRLVSGFVPGNRSLAYKKKVWFELGGLPEDLTMCADDSVFGRQMLLHGFKMAYAPDALVYWSRPFALKAFWKEQYNYGRGDGEAGIKTPVAFRLYKRGILPAFLIPFVTGVRQSAKWTVLYGIFKAVCKFDLTAALLLPIFAFGRGFSLARGYLVGDRYGSQNCQSCRSRLVKSTSDII